MMQLSLTTPALLFPAISLLLLAYTNRFLTLATVVRAFSEADLTNERTVRQVVNFRRRISLIKQMQAFGVGSFLFCVICMFLVHMGYQHSGSILFAISLLMLAYSLALSVWEIRISAEAINIHLEVIEQKCDEQKRKAGKSRWRPRK
ncbi:DUF2721 domain-containing protein [Neiella marina]|uniref:DUF2721 domain-containing protein n=2 Tax=Neiella marina TaxID=508461 RepID=A0A8J2U9L2_9GAMM|nr:DUF2721 domain-containing protein [Neiella marina]